MDAVSAIINLDEVFWLITFIYNAFDQFFFHCHRLAALEIGRFQDQLIRKLTDDMNAQHHTEGTGSGPATGAVIVPHYHMQEHEWTLARAFLYSLTVLTTIGKSLTT